MRATGLELCRFEAVFTECLGAGVGNLLAFDNKMLPEEFLSTFTHEVVGCQYAGENRNTGVHLRPHQAINHSGGNEVVPIDTAINDQACTDDRGIVA